MAFEIYVHIPFCVKKCSYCDFASGPASGAQIEAYVNALIKEIALRQPSWSQGEVSTLFIGGGTPSLLSPWQMGRILDALHGAFPFEDKAECTCEANPGTLTEEFLQALCRGGINRLSLGAQAFQDHHLKTLGRIHRWDQVLRSMALSRSMGIGNINLDLMFGLPGQTPAEWRETLSAALAAAPTHLSCYGLILEPGTPLESLVEKCELVLPSDEEERLMYDDALSMTEKAGYRQYEISNFALPGHGCRHNIGYWDGTCYLGLGAAAASYTAEPQGTKLRSTNTVSPAQYIACIEEGRLPTTEEISISPKEARFETMMLGLRMTKGVTEAAFQAAHGMSIEAAFPGMIPPMVAEGLLQWQNGALHLTRRGMDVQNNVLVRLMGD